MDSAFKSPADIMMPSQGDDVRGLWKFVRTLTQEVNDLRRANAQLRNLLPAAQGKLMADDFFPFAIYRLPSNMRDNPIPAIDWCKFRVRAGNVGFEAASGTDAVNEDPFGAHYPLSTEDDDGNQSLIDDFIIPPGTQYFWFWIQINPDDAGNMNPAVQGGGLTLQQAKGFFFDGYKILLGYVDTLTYQNEQRAIVNQFWMGHVPIGPKMTACQGGSPKHYFIPCIQTDVPPPPAG